MQFDAFMGFATSQRLGSKTAAYPNPVLLSLLKTRLGEGQIAQQIYASSLLETESAHPLEDWGSESTAAAAAAAKKRSAAFLDTVLTALGRRLNAADVRPSRSSFMLNSELHNPENPRHAAICDT